MQRSGYVSDEAQVVKDGTGDVADWVDKVARAGYLAKGAVYGLVGVITAGGVLFGEGRITGSRGALSQLQGETFGQVVLGAIAIGLIGYVIWRFVQAIVDPEREGSDASGIATRALMLISGLIYASLAIYTFNLLLSGGGGGGGGSGSTQSWTARLMSEPMGTVLVALIGAAIFIYGGVQVYKAITASFMKKMKTAEMSLDERTWSERISRLGLAARGVVFFVIGGFFFWAAIRQAPQEARGLEGALQTLATQPYGSWILGAVAIGLVCYGAYNWVESRWRIIGPHKPS